MRVTAALGDAILSQNTSSKEAVTFDAYLHWPEGNELPLLEIFFLRRVQVSKNIVKQLLTLPKICDSIVHVQQNTYMFIHMYTDMYLAGLKRYL